MGDGSYILQFNWSCAILYNWKATKDWESRELVMNETVL